MKKIIGLIMIAGISYGASVVTPPGIQVNGLATNNNVMVYSDGMLLDSGVAPTNLVSVTNLTADIEALSATNAAQDALIADNLYTTGTTNKTLIDAAISAATPSDYSSVSNSAFQFAEYLDSAVIQTNTGNPKFILVGDSLTALNNTYLETTTTGPNARGYFNHARGFLPTEVTVVTNIAIGGAVVSQMLALTNAVTTSEADYVVCMIGRNNIFNGGSYEDVRAEIETLLDAYCAAGKTTFLMTLLPSETHVNDPASEVAACYKLNRWIKDINAQYIDVYGVDVTTPLIEFTDMSMPTNSTTDNVHFSAQTAQVIGYHLAQKIKEIVPQCSVNAYGRDYIWYTSADTNENVLTEDYDAFFDGGSGWANFGGGFTVDYTSTGAVMTITNATYYYSNIYCTETYGSGFDTNDTIYAQIDISWDITEGISDTDTQFFPHIQLKFVSAGTVRRAFFQGGTEEVPCGGKILKTGRATLQTTGLPAENEALYFYVGFMGIRTGTVTIHNISVWKE